VRARGHVTAGGGHMAAGRRRGPARLESAGRRRVHAAGHMTAGGRHVVTGRRGVLGARGRGAPRLKSTRRRRVHCALTGASGRTPRRGLGGRKGNATRGYSDDCEGRNCKFPEGHGYLQIYAVRQAKAKDSSRVSDHALGLR
jgi:hypothetical protein